MFRALAVPLSFLFSVGFGAGALAETVTLQQSLSYTGTTDVWISAGQANTNKDTQGLELKTESEDSAVIRFAIFQSEGGPVPNNATILSATLSLYKWGGPDGTFKASRLLRSFNETQATWNIAASGASWSAPGANGAGSDYLATADGQAYIGSATTNGCGAAPYPAACWLNLDVSTGVIAFRNGTPNHGWKIALVSSSASNYKAFNSSENNGFPQLRPKLTIEYTTSSSPCSTGTLRPYDQAPVSGSPIAIAASGATTFEAEHFNCGGQGVAYHDNVGGNAGNANYRTGEDVDIRTSSGSATPVITNFETGEWLKYTINVASAGTYDIAILASNNGATAQFHLEVDEANVGTISVPNTGSWDTFAWHTKTGVSLTAGQHVLTLQADLQYGTVDQIRLTATTPPAACNTGSLRPYDQAPVNGNPIAVPSSGATFEAEYFNCGGQSVAYHDNVTGNAGNANFRTTEDIDIRTSTGSSTYVITNFETGEWLTYTINVATAGSYDIGILASNNGTPAQFHLEVDGAHAGTISVPVTGSWDSFTWHTKAGVSLAAGQRVLKLYADQQYGTVDQLRILPAGAPPSSSCGSADLCANWEAAETQFSSTSTFTTSSGGMTLHWTSQNKAWCSDQSQSQCRDRITLVSPGREGSTAIQLTTLSADTHVNSDGTMERSQIFLSEAETGVSEGEEQWWAHSLKIPSGSNFANAHGWGMSVFSFWSTPDVNFLLSVNQRNSNGLKTFFRAATTGSNAPYRSNNQYDYQMWAGNRDIGQCLLEPVVRDVWYDFVHRIKWSSTGQGRHTIWARKEGGAVIKVLDRGLGSPSNQSINTLFSGYMPRMKTGTYHDTLSGVNTWTIHDRLRRGTSADAVRMPDFTVDLNAPLTDANGFLLGCPGAKP